MRKVLTALIGLALALSPMALAGPAEARAAYSVTFIVSKATIDYGSTVTLSGKVSPNAKGQRVRVQRKVGSATTWTTIAKPKLSRASRFSLTIKPGPGPVQYRVVKPKLKKRAAGTSPTRTLNVKRWRDVTALTPLAANQATFGTFNAGLVTYTPEMTPVFNAYPNSVALRTGGSVEWNIADWHCTHVRARLGVREGSPTDTIYFLTTWMYTAGGTGYGLNDSEMRYYSSIRAMERPLGNYGILGDQRLRFEGSRTDGGAASFSSQVVIGTPQVYCNS